MILPDLQVFAANVHSKLLLLSSLLVRDESTHLLLDTKHIAQNRVKPAAANPCLML